MLRSNQQFDEIRIVGGIAERTGNTAGRSAIRGRQNANNANTISSILAPRVIRFGVRVTF